MLKNAATRHHSQQQHCKLCVKLPGVTQEVEQGRHSGKLSWQPKRRRRTCQPKDLQKNQLREATSMQ